MTFSSFGLHSDLLRAVEQLGFATPTPIQAEAIPPALAGRDVMACAMTGSGKTAAFLLPIMQRLLERPRGTTRALVLTPTRELAAQIEQHFRQLSAHTRLTAAAVFGGVAAGPQEQAFRRGVDVLIATPGRLLDHLKQPYARLDQLEVLVLDEADRMLDMGFLPDIRRVLSYLPKARQTMFFSATMPGPIVELARDMLCEPLAINLERKSAPATGVTQAVYPVAEDLKPLLFLELIRRGALADVIVFTRTKHRANRLAEVLERGGVRVARIHGNRSQAQRSLALDGFKRGEFQVLVATDIVARGIDVEELSHVVNFDVPHLPEDYIHRVGRTARAEATGDAYTFVSKEEEGDLRAIERAIGRTLPRLTAEGFDYGQKAPERFEVPVHERIAAIRSRRAEERKRAQEKAARRAEREAQDVAKRNGKSSPAPAARGGNGRASEPRHESRPPHAAAAHPRHDDAPAPYREDVAAPARPAASKPAVAKDPARRERVRGAWSPSREQAENDDRGAARGGRGEAPRRSRDEDGARRRAESHAPRAKSTAPAPDARPGDRPEAKEASASGRRRRGRRGGRGRGQGAPQTGSE